MIREFSEGMEDSEKKNFESRSISRLAELCPEGTILLLDNCEEHITKELKALGRDFEYVMPYKSSQPSEDGKPDDYEKYAGVLLPLDLQIIPSKELPLILNTAWNGLKTGGMLSIMGSDLGEELQEKLGSLLKQAGFFKLEESNESGYHSIIAVKPRLGTNLLDYGVDERAAGQAP
jgi:hypothetical protein